MSSFVDSHKEVAEFNQYWYSPRTIATILDAVAEPLAGSATPPRCAFVSTPSLFFSLDADSRRSARHVVLDLDSDQFAAAGGDAFVHFDFRQQPPEEHLPAFVLGAFDVAVIDPPFITEEVWRLYAVTARALLKPSGRVICTTVAENASLIEELFPGAKRTDFQPSIPHLVYQYDLFCNWESVAFKKLNPELL
jgi:EEF1A lysine methyltransferase 1